MNFYKRQQIQWKFTANKISFNVRKDLLTECEVCTGKYLPEVFGK